MAVPTIALCDKLKFIGNLAPRKNAKKQPQVSLRLLYGSVTLLQESSWVQVFIRYGSVGTGIHMIGYVPIYFGIVV